MPWQIITYRLPKEPSRHRVAVWRELRRLGAVSLQQGTWAVPAGEGFDEGLAQVVRTIFPSLTTDRPPKRTMTSARSTGLPLRVVTTIFSLVKSAANAGNETGRARSRINRNPRMSGIIACRFSLH